MLRLVVFFFASPSFLGLFSGFCVLVLASLVWWFGFILASFELMRDILVLWVCWACDCLGGLCCFRKGWRLRVLIRIPGFS